MLIQATLNKFYGSQKKKEKKKGVKVRKFLRRIETAVEGRRR